MSTKSIIMTTTLVGGAIGGYIPALWGASAVSMSGVLFGFLGGVAGIWIGYKITR